MRPAYRTALLAVCATATAAGGIAAVRQGGDPAVVRAVADPARPAEDRARDRYRHPVATLAFFGVKPGQRLTEYSPGGGWYTQILGQVPGPRGRYTALVQTPRGVAAANAILAKRHLTGDVATVDVAAGTSTVAPGSQDVVLTFRNIHNLVMDDNPAAARNAFAAWFAMLKPGGVLGIEEHRLPEGRDQAAERTSGYLKRSTVVRLATAAGFRLAGESEVNANPKDTADWPQGVWTLPPTYQLKDVDRAKYAAIGESDRMTLKFTKPR